MDHTSESFLTCNHPTDELRRRTLANGVEHIARQCLTCGGKVGSFIKKSTLTADDFGALAVWDDALVEQWNGRRQAHWEARRINREAEQAERAHWYRTVYLISPEWRRRRALRLTIDRHQCQARMDDCTGRATDVHHLSYRFIGNEPMFDLISVCRSCHEAIESMTRGEVSHDAA